ncbi:hypothetical protein ACSMX9_20155 [Streptomyces sp. LE64]|uniref:hypothetical protein n=1 Tax=Streptomyces sp. LE64 TaxID=3448653 RepID=UPI004041E96B
MARVRSAGGESRGLLAGAVADGVFKALLGAAFLVGAGELGEWLGVSTALVLATGTALLIGGVIEVGHVRRRPMGTVLPLMVAYDIGWALLTAAALFVARQGGGVGGELWIGYQIVAPLVLVALLARAAPEVSGRVGS